ARPLACRGVMDDEVLTPSEAAVFLKTGEQWLLRLARKGEIPSFRLGKRDVRFYASDLRKIRRVNAQAVATACAFGATARVIGERQQHERRRDQTHKRSR